MQNESVDHPSHYNFSSFEVIEVIEDWGLMTGFCLGNVIKYISRAGRKKKEVEDLKKARFYLIYFYNKNNWDLLPQAKSTERKFDACSVLKEWDLKNGLEDIVWTVAEFMQANQCVACSREKFEEMIELISQIIADKEQGRE